jgi:hypothetical protein
MGEVWILTGRPLGLGSFVCCFSFTLSSGVAIFILFQCFSAFQHSNILGSLLYRAWGCRLSFGYFRLAGDYVVVEVIEPGKFVEALWP